MQQNEQELAVIQNFNLLPRSSLEQLGKRLRLRMSLPELLFCARQYQHPDKGTITLPTLRFLDALACPEHPTLAKIAVGGLKSEHAGIASAFSDAIADLKALGKDPEKPYTLNDFSLLSARGSRPTAHPLQRACNGDVLVLLDASEQGARDLIAHARCVCDCATESPVHALLRLCTGAVLELSRLPEQLQDPLALTRCSTALLLALPKQALPALPDAAAAQSLQATPLGVVTNQGTLEIRNDAQVLLSLDASYLRSICFIRAYELQANRADLYAAAQLQAAQAYANAFAAGGDPDRVTLSAQLQANGQAPVSKTAADLLCMLLGLYRFSDAAKVAVQIKASFDGTDTQLTVTTDTPCEHALKGHGKLYLLAPQPNMDGTLNAQKLRALIDYLHSARAQGKIKALLPVCDTTPAAVLDEQACGVICNPHAAQTLVQHFQCAFLAESDFEPEGELIAVSTLPKCEKCLDKIDNIQ